MEQPNGSLVSIKEKLEAYQKLKEKYKTQREELRTKGFGQKTLPDPDSRRMKNNGAMDICCNVQAAIDGNNHFAIDVVATNDINDLNQLSSMATSAKDLAEPDEMAVIADLGYYNAPEIKKCLDAGIDVYMFARKGKNYIFLKIPLKTDPSITSINVKNVSIVQRNNYVQPQ